MKSGKIAIKKARVGGGASGFWGWARSLPQSYVSRGFSPYYIRKFIAVRRAFGNLILSLDGLMFRAVVAD